MARLNDPPIPSHSSSIPTAEFDALKRRFTRQNRDLARTNSAQSLRIRNLETEVAKLLNENLALREAVIASQKETERYRRQDGLGAEVVAMKRRLEEKLADVGALVQELGMLPEKASRRRKERSKSGGLRSSVGEIVKSPDQRDWRNRQTIAGVLKGGIQSEGEEGRLPPIVEGKLYPRRTLEVQQIEEMRGDVVDGESPEIGPPPVAHFDAAGRGSWGELDVSSGSESKDGLGLEDTILKEDGDGYKILPVNLERRRKRRTSSLLSDLPTPSESESDAPESKPAAALFKSGAKRKLDVSELEDVQTPAVKENDDFVYQRRPALKRAGRKSGRFVRASGQQQGDIIIPPTIASPQKERIALGEKSTNSPAKRPQNVDGKDSNDIDKPRIPAIRHIHSTQPVKERGQHHGAIVERPVHPALHPDQTSDLAPKTPFAPEDIFSPVSTEPSTKNKVSKAPQEAAITNSVEDVLNGSLGRASRRAKAAVNYAQPNLRDKMRRPGKELLSAVDGIDKRSREPSTGPDFGRSQSERPDEAIKVKAEQSEEDGKWKKLPLVDVKMSKAEPTSPLSDKKKSEPEVQAKTAARRAERQVQHDQATDVNGLDRQVQLLSIFDPPSSSPAEGKSDAAHEAAAAAAVAGPNPKITAQRKARLPSSSSAPVGKSDRRHSMVPSASAPAQGHGHSSSASGILTSRSTNAIQRPSSAASSRHADAEGKRHGIELKRSTSSAAMRSGSAAPAVGAGAENGDSIARARADRIASRRRSMMI